MKIVIFDTETTGLLLPYNASLADQPKIIEFYGVAINEEFQIVEEVNTFINPHQPLTAEITRITGIKDSDVADAPSFYDVADQIQSLFCDSDLAVAHNIDFDHGMVANEFRRIDDVFDITGVALCTVEVMKSRLGHRISLGRLYKKFFGKNFVAHRAKNDVMALVRVFHHLTETGVIDLAIYQE